MNKIHEALGIFRLRISRGSWFTHPPYLMIGGVAYSTEYLLSLFKIKCPDLMNLVKIFLTFSTKVFLCSSILNKICEWIEPYVGRFRQTAGRFVIRDEIFRILGIRHKYDGPLIVSEIDKWKESVVESHQTITEVNRLIIKFIKIKISQVPVSSLGHQPPLRNLEFDKVF